MLANTNILVNGLDRKFHRRGEKTEIFRPKSNKFF